MQLKQGNHYLSSVPTQESNTDSDSLELARFRAEWKAEVERKRNHLDSAQSTKGKTLGRNEDAQGASKHYLLNRPATRATAGARVASESTDEAAPTAATRSHPATSGGIITSAVKSEKHERALGLYREAIQHEQNGAMDSALASYRQAFRLYENVDRTYQLEQKFNAKLQSHPGNVQATSEGLTSPQLLAAELQALSIREPSLATSRQVAAHLASIIESWPHDLIFEPEDDQQVVHFNILPAEIMYLIIRKMSISTIERFALVSRKARLVTLDPVYWSTLVRKTYKPPQLPEAGDLLAIISKHNSNFRQLFIAQPRVRTDGLYIAICHYTRSGLSENSWVNVTHLVTYHRYLRFYPNGQVLSLQVASEALSPQQVIPIIKPTLRMKGFHIGNWYLTGTTLSVVNLVDASGKYIVPSHDDTLLVSDLSSLGFSRQGPSPSPDPMAAGQATSSSSATPSGQAPSSTNPGDRRPHHSHGHGHGASAPELARYVFDMSLELRSKPLGKWNRLDLVTHDSVNLETGDVLPIPPKHQRPFWFSKVKSYG